MGGQEFTPAVDSLHRFLLQESARLERWRGAPSGRIGVRALACLLQSQPSEGYARGERIRAPRATLCAAAIDEPGPEENTVPMLEALPPEDASFYSCEANVMREEACSEQLFQDVTGNVLMWGRKPSAV